MRRIVPVITAAAFILALILLLDVIPFLRGGFGWQWPYIPVDLVRILPLAITAIIYLLGAGFLLQRSRGIVAWSLLGAVTLPVIALLARSDNAVYELFVRTASGSTTGPHLAAAIIDWSDPAWVNWPETVAPFAGRSGHIVLSGPGLPLWYAALNTGLEFVPAVAEPLQRALIPYQCRNYDLLAYTPAQWASAWFGMLMPLWAALAVLPLYSVARRLTGEQAARLAVSWWPLVPALVLFTPTWNTLYPLFSLVALWMLLHGLNSVRGWLWHTGTGLLSGLMIFANFSLIPLLGLFGFYTLIHYRRWHVFRAVIVGLWFGAGLIIPWLLFWMASGLTPFDLLSYAMANHLILERPYLPWLWLHFWEWALMTGIPLVALWLLRLRKLGTLAMANHLILERPYLPWLWLWLLRLWMLGTLALALALTMLVLLLSGTARGETGRVWLFFAPFVLIAAAPALASLQGRVRFSWWAISLGQVALLLVLVGTWDVINAPDMAPPPLPPGAVVAGQPVDAVFDGVFRLASWEAQVDGDSVALHLNWDSLEQVTIPYWFAALLVAPDGTLPQEPMVWQALDTRYPTTCWKPGETVGDRIMLPLPESPQTGDWWISLSVFPDKADPEDRLPVLLPDGTQDRQVGLGPVTVR